MARESWMLVSEPSPTTTNPSTVPPTTTSAPSPTHRLIRADLLIPGDGDAIPSAALVFSPGSSIAWVGASTSLPAHFRNLHVTAHVPVLMPGLWDSHIHLTGSPTLTLDNLLFLNQALAGARLARDLAATLNAGYTSVRELAGHGWAVRQAVQEGWLAGPNIYSSVSMLSITAGHGDCHLVPVALVHKAAADENVFELADGVDECVRAVRKKIRQGADCIKVAASGGVISRLDDPKRQQFSVEEMEAMVSEAKKFGRIVTAHCHGKPGIMAALRAGCLGIEHGTYLDDEAIELMKEKGAILVATRSIASFGIEHPETMPPEVYRKMQEVNKVHREAYAKAVKAGVRIALGTDIGPSSEAVRHNHGQNARELVFAVEAGMTNAQAITAATARGPETLGEEMAPKSGQLKEGYDADFIAVAKNPLDDVKVLLDTDNITHVWKTGNLYKSPGRPVGLLPAIQG